MFGRKQNNDGISASDRIAQIDYATSVRDFTTNQLVHGNRATDPATIQRIVELGKTAGISREQLVADADSMRSAARRSR